MKKIVLASCSPRRKELLSAYGYNFEVVPSDFDEKVFSSDPIGVAKAFAFEKAKNVFEKIEDKENTAVIGADTVVFYNGEILGKESDIRKAHSVLEKLSNNTHAVITGYAIITNKDKFCDYDISYVTFNNLSYNEIMLYLKSGLYLGKAGCYGIQDGYSLVKSYSGSLNNIIGLPIEKIMHTLNLMTK